VSEKAIRKLAGPSKPAESAQIVFAGMMTAAAAPPPATGMPCATPTGDDAARPMPLADDRAGGCDPITAPADDNEPVPMSLDGDASDRTLDRQLAYLGLLDDAAPLFREGSSVPGVGVLVALPCLVESGLLRISRKLCGEIGPAFYGLRTTLLTLLFMALLRIKRPEHLKECDPAAFGRLLGLDRAPEAKTLRRRLTRSRRTIAPITASAPSRQTLTWRAASWPCPPAPTTGSTTRAGRRAVPGVRVRPGDSGVVGAGGLDCAGAAKPGSVVVVTDLTLCRESGQISGRRGSHGLENVIQAGDDLGCP
jgi:hypothetical protein